jgi:hypothetical protein
MASVAIVALGAAVGAESEGGPKGYVCYRASTPVKVDGKLDDEAWKAAPWTDAFVDIEGAARPAPRFGTRAKMLWDETYFYVGATLEEPHVWGTLKEHDAVIFHDNDFEVFIDPDGDNHEYYEVEINALNTEWDLRLVKPYRDGGPALNSWEIPGLVTAVHVEGTRNDPKDRDRGWSVELAFPWKALAEFARRHAPPRDGDQWRVNFSRVEWQVDIIDGAYKKRPNLREDNWVWSPQGVIDMHRPEKWGYVQFSTAPPGTVVFRPDPTAAARELLLRVYFAQKDYHKAKGRWADSVAQLNLPDDGPKGLARTLTLKPTGEGYEATVEAPAADGTTRRLHIRQDSRIWPDGAEDGRR